MKVFVLEDDPGRIMYFEQRLAAHEVTYADSCTQVGRFVGGYDLVLLDHDLGGRQIDTDEDCGLTFLRAVKDKLGDAAVMVHSFNYAGAANMVAEYPPAVATPFLGRAFHALMPRFLGECQN